MSKEQKATEKANTAAVTENPTDNKDLLEQFTIVKQQSDKLHALLELSNSDRDWIARYWDDITSVRLSDVRNLLKLLPNVNGTEMHGTIVNVLHSILDEIETDVEIICELSIDELIARYHEYEDDVLRGGGD